MSSPESTGSFYSATGEDLSPSSGTPSEIEYSVSGSSMEDDDDSISHEEVDSPQNSTDKQFDKDLKALLFERIRLRRLIRDLKYDVVDLKEENATLASKKRGKQADDLMDYDQDSPVGTDPSSLNSDADDDGGSDNTDSDIDVSDSDVEDFSDDGVSKDRELDAVIDALEDDEEEDSDEEDSEEESEEETSAEAELEGEQLDGLYSDDDSEEEVFTAPDWCVPIKANVMRFDWEALGKEVQFDVIVADPPWQLATQAPTRGVAIGYDQLPDICIEDIPIDKLQTNGFIFIWVINNKYAKAFEMMEKWGYSYVDDITWVKQTINRRMAKGHGFYLQHAKETCLVGRKGADPPNCRHAVGTDIIFAERRGQSQKPEEIYELIERLVPNGKYLEIFGRKNNLRDFWVTVGNEL